MYDPMVGRFLEEDPIGFAAGDPNLFRYVGNSATNRTDPSGLDWKPQEVAKILNNSPTGKTILKFIQAGFVEVYPVDEVFVLYQDAELDEKGKVKKDANGQIVWGPTQREKKGAYESEGKLFIPSSYTPVQAAVALAHEATHGMQEWSWTELDKKKLGGHNKQSFNAFIDDIEKKVPVPKKEKEFFDSDAFFTVSQHDFGKDDDGDSGFERAVKEAERIVVEKLRNTAPPLFQKNDRLSKGQKEIIADSSSTSSRPYAIWRSSC